MKTIIEPFRIKSVEPIHFTTVEERETLLKQASYNPFLLKAQDVIIDLLTDSGTNAMSTEQWAGIMRGDESYAGSSSFYHFKSVIQGITGMPVVIPTHQGRAAEKILFTHLGGKGKYVLSNTLFDTTRANIEYSGAEGVDLLCPEGKQPSLIAPFKGNMDTTALENFIGEKGAANISMVIITVTNNSGGGQPVSMENIKAVSGICRQHGILFFIDACRFAENCWFIREREAGYKGWPVREIAKELFSYADGCTMSAKKDSFANIGGFLALHDEKMAEQFMTTLVITEGFPTYGGLAGRDLEAIAIGLKEVMDEDYLLYRIRSIEYIGEQLEKEGIPFIKPTGGHALYLDAAAFLPHIPAEQFPGLALCAALYVEGGIRGVEIGSVMFGKYDSEGNPIPAPMELVRLAIPRRVYTQSHMDYVTEVIVDVFKKRHAVSGYKIAYEAPFLRHFTARFEPLL
ncbi:tryptophanase [Pararcticibacter amylolyticus]|uniref:Tyrosine phenol-lyase n=1 Tax=Pararcticibacter amylolyticus TaxID=2173175 RepID=A0A2U2PFI1_9SPHI|nr:tryptophanase [Pararcticibacter amylolyticus]PWG79889.1 tyrosine phenol-lyase [Pararcticibacter amylolyticus]